MKQPFQSAFQAGPWPVVRASAARRPMCHKPVDASPIRGSAGDRHVVIFTPEEQAP